ncbi:MAG TPA: MlaD family protein [Chloroflexota bacterium]|nr:MlaD family protein [Chloroflexota bacterium]
MSKRAPSTTQLIVIAAFALSCFGILLFLWVTFGGPTPFRAKPYEIKVPFDEATQLAEQSDVRISGVNVGKVQNIVLAPNRHQALATVDIDDKYAPLPEKTRAILRTKTLLGETYIELTPGPREGAQLADGGTLPSANIAQSVQLDEIFRTFDPKTRKAFQTWMQDSAAAVHGQGQNLSYGIGQLEPTFASLDRLFRVLDTQRAAVGQLFRNTATTVEALRGREGQLQSLIRSSDAVFSTTARRNRDIEALFRAFPTFLDESQLTLARLKSFSLNADPLMKQLVPVAKQLSPTLIAFANQAPEARGFFEGLVPVIANASTGFPALRKIFRDEFPPLLRASDPFLRNLNPFLTGLNLYKHEVTSFLGNVTAATNAIVPVFNDRGENLHYVRALSPLTPESLATFDRRVNANRNSAYRPPLWAKGVEAGLPSFITQQCGSGLVVSLDPDTPSSPAFQERVKATETKNISEASKFAFEQLRKFAFGEQSSTSSVPAPGCTQQTPMEPVGKPGAATTYPHFYAQQGQ